MSEPAFVLVKHAQPVLEEARPPRDWRLSPEGEAQAERLAEELRRFLPFRLIASPEPKAAQTCGIVAERLGLAATFDEGFRELDRPAQPILSPEDHAALNERLFVEFDRAVAGIESARSALDRFSVAVERALATSAGSIVVITHGTVIALFVASTNPSIDAFELWNQLRCPSYVVLDRSFALRELVPEVRS
jgi:broad specificity phosphatase PhoE